MQIGNTLRGEFIRIILLIIIQFLFLSINAKSANYIIKNNDTAVGYCKIIYNGTDAKESCILFDGFSKEYTETYYDLINYPNIKIKKYIMPNSNPIKITYNGKKLLKQFDKYATDITYKHNELLFPINIGNSVFSIILLNKYHKNKALFLLSADNVNIRYIKNGFMFNDINVKIYGHYPFPDSVKIGNYTYIKGNYKEPYNPYKDYIITVNKEYYIKKKFRKKIKINNVYGEFAWNRIKDKIVIILPIDIYSDMYGTLFNKYFYTAFQIAENIDAPTFIFDFNTISLPDIKTIKNSIDDVIDYFSKTYKDIIVISYFNLYLSLDNKNINYTIAINPPFNDYKYFAKKIYNEYKGINGFQFSNFNNFIKYDPFYTDKNIVLNNKNTYYIFSKRYLSKDDIKTLKNMGIKGIFINNVDMRLYSCNMKNIKKLYINNKILNLINNIIKKE